MARLSRHRRWRRFEVSGARRRHGGERSEDEACLLCRRVHRMSCSVLYAYAHESLESEWLHSWGYFTRWRTDGESEIMMKRRLTRRVICDFCPLKMRVLRLPAHFF